MPTKMRSLFKRLVGGLVLLAFALVLSMIGQVLLHRFVPVPATYLAFARTAQGQGYSREWRPIEKISPNLVYAVIAAEDSHFCTHMGFDVQAIEKALRHNAKRPGKVRGGSTISQQTAKNAFLWPGRSWIRKGFEAADTVLIEALWGKRRIMEVYLNIVEWAPGVYGAQAAARRWYGVDADKLTPSQAARLAAILPKPLAWKAAASGPYVRRRGAKVGAAIGTVRRDGLAACVLD
jgi:monofunctional biosynthetic peptidoglycan transglycosylase